MGYRENCTGIVKVELIHVTKGDKRVMDESIALFRDVVSYLTHVVADNLEAIMPLSSYDALTYIEHLVHVTKDNPAVMYPMFDVLYKNLPCNIRRAAVHAAHGHVRSHETRCAQYYEGRDIEISRGHHYKKMAPAFTYTPNAFPSMYKNNSFKLDLADNQVTIKVRIRNTWDWITLPMASRDAKYLRKALTHGKMLNPKLVYAYHKYYLEFPVVYNATEFIDVPLEEQTVMSVDLGFNHPATCSVVDLCGTVHKRLFAPFQSDMGRIDHVIGLIRKYQGLSGKGQSLASLYTKLQGLKENFVKQLSRWLVNNAIRYDVHGIVLENLSGIHKGKRKGRSLKARVHHWCVCKIRDFVRNMAFREGIRTFIINPRGTSMYAFDGSGKVVRDPKNAARCIFQNGKEYDCDLSASYNIAARYFLREIKKAIPATEWSAAKAKVPGLSKRTNWTLSTLRGMAGLVKARAA